MVNILRVFVFAAFTCGRVAQGGVENAVWHAVANFGTLGVVEPVKGANEVASNATNALEWRFRRLFTTAFRAHVAVDVAVESALRVGVDGVVNRAVSDARLAHRVNDFFESVEVLGRVAVKLNVSDVTSVRQGMIRRFKLDLLPRGGIEVNRNMEAIGVIFAIGNAFDFSETLAVDLINRRQPLCGRSKEREIQLHLSGFLVKIMTHEETISSRVLGSFTFTVMKSNERLAFPRVDKPESVPCLRTSPTVSSG